MVKTVDKVKVKIGNVHHPVKIYPRKIYFNSPVKMIVRGGGEIR